MFRTSISRPRFCAVVFVLALALPLGGAAAEPMPRPGDTRIEAFLANEARRLSGPQLDGATTKEAWEARRPRLKQELLDMLGLSPLPEKTPLRAQVTGTVDRDGGVVIENLHFQSRPGLYVTGNLYRPKQSAEKLPAVLYVCGHSGMGRDGNKTAFQDHGMWFARNGYVCLIVDTLQLGEVASVHHGTYRMGRWWWQAAGYTPAGVECWNGIRAIDYLCGRTDVDPARIGVTGISGGGAATFWIAAVDDRVRCAVPISGMSDLESYVTNKVVNGHCDCMFCYNAYQWEWTTIAALIAPRPLLFGNSDEDSIFPMDGNGRIIERLRRLYTLYGKPELVADHVSHGGHDYRPDLRVAAFGWINRHLKNDSGPVGDATDAPIDGKRLRAFPDDRDLPTDARNATIDEDFVPRAQVVLPSKGEEFAPWKRDLVRQLRDRPFRSLPDRVAAASPLAPAASPSRVRALTTEAGIEVTLWEQRGAKHESGDATLIVLNPGEELEAVPDWARSIVKDGDVLVLAPRGVGPSEWTHRSPPNYVERAHVLLGRTVDEGRVRDVAAALRWLRSEESPDKRRWTVAGSRQAGILAAYAALLEPSSAAQVVAVDPPASHRDGPIFLGVLRVLDIPDALGLLAPMPLRLIGASDPAFERTINIYKLAGAIDQVTRSVAKEQSH
ncbi:prolyl oligopeptidase family serine peptidase [Singulisphaera sp. Ch08]|uniref:Prolyl oligopeptidase family serine peptidase n=1 Tax=Singulisphaera sp. Ch08 TaxID=3120278 RepID=A0AAU7C9N5_9BACT